MLTRIDYSPSPSVLDPTLSSQFTRVTAAEDIPLLYMFANTATEVVENYISRFLITRDITWTIAHNSNHSVYHSGWAQFNTNWTWMQLNNRWLNLPRTASAVGSVTLGIWGGDDVQLIEGVDYDVDLSTDPGRIKLYTWTNCYSVDHMKVVMTTGYGPTPDYVPMPIKQAVYLIAANLYENRGDSSSALITPAVEHLLANFVSPSFGY